MFPGPCPETPKMAPDVGGATCQCVASISIELFGIFGIFKIMTIFNLNSL
jgi:hypothetical protein